MRDSSNQGAKCQDRNPMIHWTKVGCDSFGSLLGRGALIPSDLRFGFYFQQVEGTAHPTIQKATFVLTSNEPRHTSDSCPLRSGAARRFGVAQWAWLVLAHHVQSWSSVSSVCPVVLARPTCSILRFFCKQFVSDFQDHNISEVAFARNLVNLAG